MKNNEPFRGLSYHHLKKTLLIMRIAIILLLVGFFQTRANDAYSQKTRLSINFSNTELGTVLDKIENQSEFYFLYNEKLIDANRKVSIDAKNEGVEDVLKSLFEGTDVKYLILDRKIILSPDEIDPAQQSEKKVTGTVKDANGQPIPGVSVIIKGSTNGTVTDADGKFNLTDVPAEGILRFSFVGMKPQEITVGNKTMLNLTLIEETVGLDEVITIGYGTTRKKDLTGAVAVVSSKEFESRPTANIGDALEGKIAGVQISKPSGQPQSGYNITIRGISTITAGSEPLYIVDGVPTTSINQIEPTDIESMSILKDASAAAIYGSSGANGVVLITTKRGSNQATRVTFNSYYETANVLNKLDVLNASQYKSLMTEMGQPGDLSIYPYNTNWQDQVFRTGNTKSTQLGVSGGNEKTSFYLSGSYYNQDGSIINNSMEKYSFRVNLDHKVSDFLKVGTSVSYNKWYDVSLPENGRWSMGNSFLTGSPVIGVRKPDGTFYADPFIPDLENPVALLTENQHGYTNMRFNGNAYVEMSFTKDLKFKSMFGLEEQTGIYRSWIDPYQSRQGRMYQGIAGYNTTLNSYWISENTLSYNKVFNKHNFGAMGGFIASKNKAENSSINAKGFGSAAVQTVNAGTTISATYGESAKSNVSYVGRLNYGYADKYLVTANIRADGSSVFGANHKWGYFPSFSAGWRISKEDFYAQNSFVNDLKVRAGWGIVGNDQIGNYASFGTVNPGSAYVIGGNKVPGTAIASIENADLKWEQTAQTNIGIDASILNNRIVIAADYYIKNTSNMLLLAPIPSSVGIPGSVAEKNIGSMYNKGFEFQVSSKNLIGQLKWTTDFNISFNRNKITKLEKGVPVLGGYIDNRADATIAKEGQPLGMFYGYVALGVDPQTGIEKYKTADTSGALTDADKTIIGNANPDFIYGLTNNFSYKRFNFSFFFQGVQGNQILNASRIVTEGMYYPINQLTTVLTRWEKPGDITNMPKSDAGNLLHNSEISSRFVENGSYLRLKSVTLGYDLPKSICDKLKAQKLRVYVTSENLLTITKYSGFDPEVSLYGPGVNKGFSQGIDMGAYPQARSYMLGVNLTF